MVSWFKHDIAAWTDGTEALSDGAYRAYHVICQLIYQNEGSIAVNEKGIAGRCNQSIRAFRRNLEELLKASKLTLANGRLSNARANLELEKIAENRINAGKGGVKSGERRKVQAKVLENNASGEASLHDNRSLKDKTRVDESRPEQTSCAGELQKGIVKAFEDAKSPFMPDTGYVEVWLSQGFDPSIIFAVVSEGVTRKPSVRSLKYFDAAIQEAHNKRAPAAMKPAEINWESAISSYKATGNWPRWAPGPEPGMAGCCAPSEILIKHGLGAAQEETPQEAAKVGGR